MLGRKDDDWAMDLEMVKIMWTIHMDYTNEVYIKYSFQIHELLYLSILRFHMSKLQWKILQAYLNLSNSKLIKSKKII
jgi:hypothetical protein